MLNLVHLIDDVAVGGVVTALNNFKDPRLRPITVSAIDEIEPRFARAKAYKDDIIILHFTMSWAKLPYLLHLRLKNPDRQIFLVEHSYTAGFETHNVESPSRFRLMLKIAYALCDRIVAVSHGQAAWLASLTDPSKLFVIPQSRPTESFRRLAKSEGAQKAPVRFGAIGRFHRQKGFDILINAFRRADRRGATLDIAGYGEEEEALKTLAGGDPSIRFVGLAKDATDFYRSVDVVIVPSRWEAFGLVASEAMASGRYVAAAKIDGLPEQIVGCGATFPSDNIEGLERLLSAICSGDKSICVADRSRDRACKRYDHLIALWSKLLTDAGRPKPREERGLLSSFPKMLGRAG